MVAAAVVACCLVTSDRRSVPATFPVVDRTENGGLGGYGVTKPSGIKIGPREAAWPEVDA